MTMAGSGWAKSATRSIRPLRPERVQELVHHRPHVRFEPGNVPREERVLHRPPELPVAGRIVEYHPVRQGSGEERDVRAALAAAAPLLESAHLLDRQPRVEEGLAHVGVAGQDPAAERGVSSAPAPVLAGGCRPDGDRRARPDFEGRVRTRLSVFISFTDRALVSDPPRADVERRSGTRRVSRTAGAGIPAGFGKLLARLTNPSTMNQMRAQLGMPRERNDQETFAHSPEPVKIIAMDSVMGNVFSMYSRPGPHSGTSPGGRFCRRMCHPAIPAPDAAAIPAATP